MPAKTRRQQKAAYAALSGRSTIGMSKSAARKVLGKGEKTKTKRKRKRS